MTRDWKEWHQAYDDPSSHLNRRLEVVVGMIREFLDAAPPGAIRCLSLCAGRAPDLARAAGGHPRAADLVGAAVELDPELAAEARRDLGAAGIPLEVRVVDAGVPAAYSDVLPVDLLLLVGIFGNISDDDIEHTVAAVPAMCRATATVIWSRHRRGPDLTPRIRRWFSAAGVLETGFESPGPGSFSVGRGRFAAEPPPALLPDRLFSFVAP